jgi:predicted anti-sigma-YlaC factor YlaD
MTCSEVDERLDDYLDGTLAEGEFQELELHLASCAACRDAEQKLRRLLAQASALPREQTPARDLWPEIAERLPSRGLGRRWIGLAAAAAIVVSAATFLMTRARPVSEPGPTPILVTAAGESPALAAAEEDFARASAALLAALNEQKASLPPETIAGVEKNIVEIDRALVEVREALRRDPNNSSVTRMLASTHRKKVEILQRVLKLTTTI